MTTYPDINTAPAGFYLMTDAGYQGPYSYSQALARYYRRGLEVKPFYWLPARNTLCTH